jgi:hypothetical protein
MPSAGKSEWKQKGKGKESREKLCWTSNCRRLRRCRGNTN